MKFFYKMFLGMTNAVEQDSWTEIAAFVFILNYES